MKKNLLFSRVVIFLMVFFLTFTSRIFSQNIDVQLNIPNSATGCSDPTSCPVYACHDQIQVTLTVTNNVSTSTNIIQNLPDGAVVADNSATVNGVPVLSNCSSTTAICFSASNGVATWTFPSQLPVISTATLSFSILFDCSLSTVQNGNKLTLSCDGAVFSSNGQSLIDYSMQIANPEIAIQNLPSNSLALQGENGQRTFDICATNGLIDAFTFSYTPEPEISNVSLTFSGNTGNVFSLSCPNGNTTTQNFSSASNSPISSFIAQGFLLDGSVCIHVVESYLANSCSPTSTVSTYTASILCNRSSCPASIPCTTCPAISQKTSNAKINESQVTELNSSFHFRDNAGSDITSGMSPCDASNGGFRFDYELSNPSTNSGYAVNSNFKSLQTFTATIPLGGPGQLGWFLTTPSPTVWVNNTQVTSGISITSSGIVLDFTQLTGIISPLTDLNHDNIPNELPGNSTINISIRDLKLNLQNSTLDNCDEEITQYIIGASSTPGTNRSKVTYNTMCSSSQPPKYFVDANYKNAGNSVIYGAPVPADAQAGITNVLNLCWENTGAPNNNPWEFTGANTLITCNSADLHYQVKLTLPESAIFTSNPNLTFDAIPGLTTSLSLPTPVSGSNNSLIYYIDNVGRSGCLSGNVTLNYNNTNVCNASMLSGTIDISAEVRAICDGSGSCSASFCIGQPVNHLYYHCPGTCNSLTGVDAISNSQPIILHRLDDISDNTGQPDLHRAYACDEIYVEVHGNKLAGTSNDIFLKLTYDQVAGNNPIFDVVSGSGINQYSIDGGNTWSNVTSISAPALSSGKWEVKAHIAGANVPNLSSTTLWFRVKLKVRSNIPSGVFNLQEIRADIGYMSGGTYHGACDTWADHMLVLGHEYNTQHTFIAADNFDYGDLSLGVCHQRLLIRNFITGGLPQSDEMPNENRPLVLWPDNNPNVLKITTDLQDMTVTNIDFSSNYGSTNIFPTNPSLVSVSATDLIVYGNAETFAGSGIYTWPSIDKDAMSTVDMTLLIDFEKQSCESNHPTTSLYFPIWTRNNSSCNPPYTPNSTSAIALTTQGATTSSIILTVNGSNQSNINLNPTSNPYIIPIGIKYTGLPYSIDNGWLFNNTISPNVSVEIGTSSSGPFTTIAQNQYYFTGQLTNGNQVDYFLRISFQDCNPQNIVLRSGYSCSPLANMPIPPDNTFDCETNTTTITISPIEPDLRITGTNLTPTNPTNCGQYHFPLTLKSWYATSYNPDFLINIPPNLQLVSCVLTYNGNTATFSTLTTGPNSVSLLTELNSLLSNGNIPSLSANSSISIVVTFQGDISNCVTGSVSPSFIAKWNNLCDVQKGSVSPLSATLNFIPNQQTCPDCFPCFANKPDVIYTASGAGCDNQQGTIFLQINAPSNVSNLIYHFQGLNGNTLNGSGIAQSGASFTGLTAGDYEVYVSFDVTIGTQVTHCSTEPQTITITKPNCCQGDVIIGTATQTFDGTITPVKTDNLTPQQISWLTTPGNVSINGTFIVNTLNFVIANCHVTFGENAKIEIINSAYPGTSGLSIENSVLETCDDWMWQGIVMDGSYSILGIYGSTIRDAVWAVRADNGATLNLKYTNFENNETSVAISNSGYAFFAPIIGCTFSNPAQDLKKPYHGNRSLVGIQTYNVDGWQIGEDDLDASHTNKFIGINCGIHSFQSNIVVYNNYFESIKNYRLPTLVGTQPQSVPNYPFRGWAVWALSGFFDKNPGKLTVRTTNTAIHFGSPQYKNFVDCDGGIYAGNTVLTAYLNNFLRCKNGIKTAFQNSRDGIIALNNLWQCLFSITLSNNHNSFNLVAANYIRNSPQYNGYPFGFNSNNTYGIRVAETTPNSTNQIFGNQIFFSTNGIWLTKTTNASIVSDNKIYLTNIDQLTYRRSGIFVENANGSYLSDNSVTGNGPQWQGGLNGSNLGFSAYRETGINSTASPNLTLSCNHTNDLGRGICFRQNCATNYDAIRENYMANNFIHLYLDRLGGMPGEIGPDVGGSLIGGINPLCNRNRFGTSTNLGGINQIGQQSNGPLETYNNRPIGASQQVPTFRYRWDGFQCVDENGNFDAFANYDNGSNDTWNQPMKIQLAPSMLSVPLSLDCYDPNWDGTHLINTGGGWFDDALRALEMTNYPVDENFIKWFEKKSLFEKLDKDESYRESMSVLANFYSDYTSENGAKLYRFQQSIQSLEKENSLHVKEKMRAPLQTLRALSQDYVSSSDQMLAALDAGDSSSAQSIQVDLGIKLQQFESQISELSALFRYDADSLKMQKEKEAEIAKREFNEKMQLLSDSSSVLDSLQKEQIKLEAETKKDLYASKRDELRNPEPDTLDLQTQAKLMESNFKLQEVYAQNNYESNEKKVGELLVKIEKEGPDALLEDEWNWIGNLANACPLAEGYAVYTARSLYSYIDNSLFYDDEELCSAVGFFKTEPEESIAPQISEKARLSYDPKASSAIVFYEFVNSVGGSIEITNLLGQKITTAKLEQGHNLAIIPLSELASSEYLYRIRSDSGFTTSGKFNVLH